jgi:hypothetical protein
MVRKVSWSKFSNVVLLFSILTYCAFAQLTDATLKGTVRDPSGAVVSHASATATNEGTGIVRTTTSDASGIFSLSNLAPGAYTLKVSCLGFKTSEQSGVSLNVGRVAEINVQLEVGQITEKVEVTAESAQLAVSTEGRLSDSLQAKQITDLPLPQRDVLALPSLSAGAAIIQGSAFSFKLTPSPSVTVNGNRFRGNNYVLDGSMDTDTINTGEPAIVPSLESIEEVQVQTGNFSSEYGRGNGSVVNIRTKSGTNTFHGKIWEYHKNAALNARNYFVKSLPPLVFNQFGGNIGGPIIKNKTFFFGSYEGTRNALGQALSFQVETPEFRDYVNNTAPSSVAASLLNQFPAPAPAAGTNGQKYQGQVDVTTPQGDVVPALGTAPLILRDYLRYDQYLTRIDHALSKKDTLTGRWIAESQRGNGATGAQVATLGRYVRGFRNPYDGFFGNLNLGEVHTFDHVVNDARFSFQNSIVSYDRPNGNIPQINISGISAPLGDPANLGSHYRVYEARDTVSFDRGKHILRVGGEIRRLFEGIYMGEPRAGSYNFNSLLSFAADSPFQQNLVVDPLTGQPARVRHYYALLETAAFLQDDWKATSRLTVNLGLRHDYFGTPSSERYGHNSSIVFGAGSTYTEQLASASVVHVPRLYSPQKTNLSPRIGLAYDPFGDGKSSIRAGFSLAYQPPHGYSINGQSADPPYAISAVLQPNAGYGTAILYGIPVPFNPEFQTELNPQGGVVSPPGTPPFRLNPWVVDPHYKTQYSESWFLSLQREVINQWIVELGYVGTNGINLERIDDINRFNGDLIVNGGQLHRINQNFNSITYITNGVTSSYHAMTAEVRHRVGSNLTLQANYRWSKWLDDGSDTSPHLVTGDNPGLNPGPPNESCLQCNRGPSTYDIPHRFTASVVWTPSLFRGRGLAGKIVNGWELSSITTAQSGRPFDVWCSASYQAGCDFNADGGGNQFGGYADRPDAPAEGAVKASFSQQDFLNGLFSPDVFPKPTPGTDGTLGRNAYRGPRQINVNLALARSFRITERTGIQARFEAFNALNNVNLYLPNNDLALALKPDQTYSSTSSFGKSTRAFDPRILQVSARFMF